MSHVSRTQDMISTAREAVTAPAAGATALADVWLTILPLLKAALLTETTRLADDTSEAARTELAQLQLQAVAVARLADAQEQDSQVDINPALALLVGASAQAASLREAFLALVAADIPREEDGAPPTATEVMVAAGDALARLQVWHLPPRGVHDTVTDMWVSLGRAGEAPGRHSMIVEWNSLKPRRAQGGKPGWLLEEGPWLAESGGAADAARTVHTLLVATLVFVGDNDVDALGVWSDFAGVTLPDTDAPTMSAAAAAAAAAASGGDAPTSQADMAQTMQTLVQAVSALTTKMASVDLLAQQTAANQQHSSGRTATETAAAVANASVTLQRGMAAALGAASGGGSGGEGGAANFAADHLDGIVDSHHGSTAARQRVAGDMRTAANTGTFSGDTCASGGQEQQQQRQIQQQQPPRPPPESHMGTVFSFSSDPSGETKQAAAADILPMAALMVLCQVTGCGDALAPSKVMSAITSLKEANVSKVVNAAPGNLQAELRNTGGALRTGAMCVARGARLLLMLQLAAGASEELMEQEGRLAAFAVGGAPKDGARLDVALEAETREQLSRAFTSPTRQALASDATRSLESRTVATITSTVQVVHAWVLTRMEIEGAAAVERAVKAYWAAFTADVVTEVLEQWAQQLITGNSGGARNAAAMRLQAASTLLAVVEKQFHRFNSEGYALRLWNGCAGKTAAGAGKRWHGSAAP
jgi:hypothetical protein